MENKPYYKLFKGLMQELGTDCACIYAVMVDFNAYAQRKNQLTEDGYFYLTIPTLEKITTLKRRRQTNAIKELIKAGYIKTKLKEMPAKRFFKIVQNEQSSLYKMNNLDCTERTDKIVQNEQSSLYKMNNLDCTERTDKIVQNEQSSLYKMNTNKEHILRTYNQKHTTKEKINSRHPIMQLYMQNYGLPNTVVLEDIKELINFTSEKWVVEGIKEGLRHNAKNWNYIKKIIERWALQYPKNAEPWEIERGNQNGGHKTNNKKVYGNATVDEWENEPAEL